MQKPTDPSSSTSAPQPARKLSILQTIQHIIATDGLLGFMRGVGPALVLVINPMIQYTVFEQLKNILVTRRTAVLRTAGGAATATAVLTDLDFFLLGALSKFSEKNPPHYSKGPFAKPSQSQPGRRTRICRSCSPGLEYMGSYHDLSAL